MGASDALLDRSTENGRIVLGGTAGTVQLLLSATETAAIDWTKGVYDLEVEFADGTVHRPAGGRRRLAGGDP